MLRTRVLWVLLLAFPGAAAAAPLSEDIPVPGTRTAWARALDLPTTPDRARFIAELSRLVFNAADMTGRTEPRPERLAPMLQAVTRFETAIDRLPNRQLSLELAATNPLRDRLEDVLALVGLRLRENRKQYRVEASTNREHMVQADRLRTLGVPLAKLADRLNAGESVQLDLPIETVPVPVSVQFWSQAVFRRPMQASEVFGALLVDAHAARLAQGLAGLDRETLEFLSGNPTLVQRLYRDHSVLLATFATNVRVRNGHFVVPGGPDALPLWESVVGERVTQPDRFLIALLSRNDGRLAYIFDLLAELEPRRRSFALGLWISDARVRLEQFRRFIEVIDGTLAEWRSREAPFLRPANDVTWMLLNVQVDAEGRPQPPAERGFWSRVFETTELPDNPAALLKETESGGPIDAASLAEALFLGERGTRLQKLDQLSFFRVFAHQGLSATSHPDMLVALRAYPSYPALMLTLERLGVATPAVYAAAARHARVLSETGGARGYVNASQFQGAVALLTRMVETGGLDAATAENLVSSLASLRLVDGSYGSLVVGWIRQELVPALAPRDTAEAAILSALAGVSRSASPQLERVEWEGDRYRLDLTGAEAQRLGESERPAATVDVALQLTQIVADLNSSSLTLGSVKQAATRVRSLAGALAPKSKNKAGPPTPGTNDLPRVPEVLTRVANDLSRISRERDVNRAANRAAPLVELAGIVLGEALRSMVYLVYAQDQATISPAELAARHDFGLELNRDGARQAALWAVPTDTVATGVPRHLLGSLFSIDITLAAQALRSLSTGAPTAPTLVWTDRDRFSQSVALLNPFSLRNEQRDAIVGAIRRGQERVRASADDVPAFDALADEIALDGWRRGAAHWHIVNDRKELLSLFSLYELLLLGGGGAAPPHNWGPAHLSLTSCQCAHFTPPNYWRLLAGRPSVGSLSATVPDVTLMVAVSLRDLNLPAALARVIMSAAMHDFLSQVRPNDADDWLALVRTAQTIRRERIEDYVAVATSNGLLRPDSSAAGGAR